MIDGVTDRLALALNVHFFQSEVKSALEHTGLVIRRVFSVSREERRALAPDPNLIRDLTERRTAEGRTLRGDLSVAPGVSQGSTPKLI